MIFAADNGTMPVYGDDDAAADIPPRRRGLHLPHIISFSRRPLMP